MTAPIVCAKTEIIKAHEELEQIQSEKQATEKQIVRNWHPAV